MQLLTLVFSAFSVLLAALALFFSTKRWRVSRIARQIAELEIANSDLASAFDALKSSHRKLAARVGMRDKRERDRLANDGSGNGMPKGMPDPNTDPDAWKRAMRAKIHGDKFG